MAGDGGPREGAHEGASGSADGGSWSSSWWPSGGGVIEGVSDWRWWSHRGGYSEEGVPTTAACEENENWEMVLAEKRVSNL
jgi:hypothetical protein